MARRRGRDKASYVCQRGGRRNLKKTRERRKGKSEFDAKEREKRKETRNLENRRYQQENWKWVSSEFLNFLLEEFGETKGEKTQRNNKRRNSQIENSKPKNGSNKSDNFQKRPIEVEFMELSYIWNL
jgi:hypothetical protein